VSWSLNKKVTTGFAVVLAILAVGEFVSYRSTRALIETSRQVSQSQRVLETLDEMLVTMDDAETGQRGFLLTGKESYLQPYQAAITRLPTVLNKLSRLTVNDPVQQHDIVLVEGHVQEKQKELAATIKLQRASRLAAVSRLVLSGRGKEEMDDVRAVIAQMKKTEENRIASRNAQWEASARETRRLVQAGVLAAFIVLLLAILALNNEASERIRVERALRHSEAQTKLLVDSVQDYAILMLDLEGRVVGWSPGAERIMGYGEKEISGQSFSCFFPAEEAEKGKPQMELEKARVSGRSAEEGWRVRKDGSQFWANAVTVAIWDDQGQLRGFSKVMCDITEDRRAQEEIRELNRSLELRASELEAANKELEAFTYSVSHDLRAPLRHIDGFSQLLIEEHGSQLPEDVCRYLGRIQTGVRQMGQLVDELLNLARIGRKEIRLQVTGLDSVVHQVIDELKPEIGNRSVEWKVGSLPFVDCDPALVKQVFVNLLSNAIKYTRPRESAVIEVGTKQENGQPSLFVRDNGVGFSMKYADKLFGVFQRLHRAEDFEGTGIGLATVQRIVHKHHGRVWAEAELDKGATFYFTLGTLAGDERKTT
jgi:PAS domain S-box-containing protein